MQASKRENRTRSSRIKQMTERRAYFDILDLLRSQSDTAGVWRSMLVGEGGDLSDVRPYEPGDKPQRIHRPSFARGQLLVKEFFGDRHASIKLVFDTSFSLARRGKLEAMSAQAARDSIHLFSALVCGAADFWGVPVGALCIFGEKSEYTREQQGSLCLARVIDVIENARVDNPSSCDSRLGLVKRHTQQSKEGLTFFVSDFLEDAESYDRFFTECMNARKMELIPVFINTSWIWSEFLRNKVAFQGIDPHGRDSAVLFTDRKTTSQIKEALGEHELKLRTMFRILGTPWINLQQPAFSDYVREMTLCFAAKHRIHT